MSKPTYWIYKREYGIWKKANSELEALLAKKIGYLIAKGK